MYTFQISGIIQLGFYKEGQHLSCLGILKLIEEGRPLPENCRQEWGAGVLYLPLFKLTLTISALKKRVVISQCLGV